MTSKTNPENTQEKTEHTTKKTTDNKALFGPLGKYAIIAVIMVSVIVTTAIMLDKQLNTTERDLAVIEKEVAELNTVSADTTAKKNEETVVTAVIVEKNTIASKVVVVETAKEANNEQSSSEQDNVVATVETEQATQAAPSTETNTGTVTEATEPTTKDVVGSEDASADVRRAQRKQEKQARLEANKVEQKQRMTKLYARINKVEQQQLSQYKSNQDKQIVRLRQQNSQKQEFIDALILRNNELLMMRKASMQKNQVNREKALNRI